MEKASTTLLAVAMVAAAAVGVHAATPNDLVVSPAVRRTSGIHSPSISQVAARTRKSSLTASVSSSLKSGWRKISKTITPETQTDKIDDPTSLFSKSKPGPELYVAVARLQEQSGRVEEAERQYEKALKEESDHLGAMLGYAHLLDRLGRSDEASKMYRKAAKVHPQEAAVHNDLGLYYARQGRLTEAVAALDRAIRLQPKRALYRNNMATVLVERGQLDAALMHFRAVHGAAVAHYNLGYLLDKRGDKRAARSQFAAALQKDPSFEAAATWLRRLQGPAERPASSSTARGESRPSNGLESRVPRKQIPNRRIADQPIPPPRQPAGGGPVSQSTLRFQPTKNPSPKIRKLPPLPQHRPGSTSREPTGPALTPPRNPAPRPLEDPPMPRVRPLPPVAPVAPMPPGPAH